MEVGAVGCESSDVKAVERGGSEDRSVDGRARSAMVLLISVVSSCGWSIERTGGVDEEAVAIFYLVLLCEVRAQDAWWLDSQMA